MGKRGGWARSGGDRVLREAAERGIAAVEHSFGRGRGGRA